jgi:hypothetical protein
MGEKRDKKLQEFLNFRKCLKYFFKQKFKFFKKYFKNNLSTPCITPCHHRHVAKQLLSIYKRHDDFSPLWPSKEHLKDIKENPFFTSSSFECLFVFSLTRDAIEEGEE